MVLSLRQRARMDGSQCTGRFLWPEPSANAECIKRAVRDDVKILVDQRCGEDLIGNGGSTVPKLITGRSIERIDLLAGSVALIHDAVRNRRRRVANVIILAGGQNAEDSVPRRRRLKRAALER